MKGNRKESIRNLHMEAILSAAEELFTEKGFDNTTIDDISKISQYSRRTVYTYYRSKDEIYHFIILKGLKSLRDDLSKAIINNSDFMTQYKAICKAMINYFNTSPHSFSAVNVFKSKSFDFNNIPPVITEIFTTGEEINNIIEQFIMEGKAQGKVKQNIRVKETVYIIWSSISGILELVKNKGDFIEKEIDTPIEEFLEYSFNQIINSILEEEKK